MGILYAKPESDKMEVTKKIETTSSIVVSELTPLSEIYITPNRKAIYTRKNSKLYKYLENLSEYDKNVTKYTSEYPILPKDLKKLNDLIRGIDEEDEQGGGEEQEESESEGEHGIMEEGYEEEGYENSERDSSTFESESDLVPMEKENLSPKKDKTSLYNFDFGTENIHNRFDGSLNKPYMEEVPITITLMPKDNQILPGGSFVKILNKKLVESFIYLDYIYNSVIFSRRGEIKTENDQFSKWSLQNHQLISDFLAEKMEVEKEIANLLDVCILKFQVDAKTISSLYETNQEGTVVDTEKFIETSQSIYNNTNLRLFDLFTLTVKKLKNVNEREISIFESFNSSLLNGKKEEN